MNKINEYLCYLEYEKRYSQNTLASYKRDLKDFSLYLIKEGTDIVDEIVIRNYLAFLYSNNLSKKTISRRISVLKSYYKFIDKKFGYDNSFIKDIKSPKQNNLLPEIIYKDELKKIIFYTFTGKFSSRNKAITLLLYSSGIRVSELCNITLDLIDIENRYIVVVGKGNKSRICPFSNHCKLAIEKYIEKERNIYAKQDCNFLFINKYGNKITPRSIENVITNLSKKLFNNKKLHPHLFRHTYATQLLNNGADLKVIQELLGHQNLMSTQIYTHLAKEEINNIYKISHPRYNSLRN